MRNMVGGAVVVLLLLTAGRGASAAPALAGDYVEARTCNVYTGACHANGEAVTAGREAMLAWHVREGAVSGVDLRGMTAMAVVVGGDNLADEKTARRTVFYVDEKATGAQQKALVGMLMDRYRKTLGTVIAVRPAPVEFARSGLEYTVRVPGTALLKTTRYACDHCIMPHAVWYRPFIGLKSSIVAKADVNEYRGGPELNTRWMRADENSSYVGEFAF